MTTQNTYSEDLKQLKRLHEDAQKKLKEEITKYYPRLAKEYGVVNRTMYFKKQAEGVSKIVPAIMKQLVYPGERNYYKTQKAILEEVRPKFPRHKIVDAIWHRELAGFYFKKIESEMRGFGMDPSIIKGCKNLSDIKKRLVLNDPKEPVLRSYVIRVTLSNEMLTVNGRQFRIFRKVSGKYSYPCVRFTSGGKRLSMKIIDFVALIDKKSSGFIE